MKKDQYFPLEVNFMSDEHVSDMMFELDSPQSLGVYIILLQHLRKADDYAASYKPLSLDTIAYTYRIDRQMLEKIIRDYELFELDEEHLMFRSPYLDRVMKRLDERRHINSNNGKKGGRPRIEIAPSETPMDKGEKPNQKQESKEEKRRSITTVLTNSSNTAKPEVSAAAVAAVEISSEDEKGQRPLQPVQHWETLVDQLAGNQSYMEIVGMHSGLGALFLNNQKHVLQLFKAHVRLYSKEGEMLFPEDVKRYFSNYVAEGSTSCRMLKKALLAEVNAASARDVTRFETLVDGQRTYLGHPIPIYAPPRPDATSVWNDELKLWTR